MTTILIIVLFLLLLLLILFFYSIPTNEGFVTFQKTANSSDMIVIPQYNPSSKVVKLYDNLFFDTANGNIIEVDSKTYTEGISVDTTGLTISNIYITDRKSGLTKNYTTNGTEGKTTDESKLPFDSTSNLITQYVSKTKHPDEYSLFYVANGSDTYIHILNNTTSKTSKALTSDVSTTFSPVSIISFIISGNEVKKFMPSTTSTITISEVKLTDKTPIKELTGLPTVKQIGAKTYIDTTSHNLILVSPANLKTSPIGDGINGATILKHDTLTTGQNYLAKDIGTGTVTTQVPNSVIANTNNDLVVYFVNGLTTVVMTIVGTVIGGDKTVFALQQTQSVVFTGSADAKTKADEDAKAKADADAKAKADADAKTKGGTEPTGDDFYKWYYWVSMSNNGEFDLPDISYNYPGADESDSCYKCNNMGCDSCKYKKGRYGAYGYGGGYGGGPGYGSGPGYGGGYGAPNGPYRGYGGTDGSRYLAPGGIGGPVGGLLQFGVNTAGDAGKYGVDTAGNAVKYGVDTAGQGVQYGVNTAGQGVQYGVNTAGQGVQYGVNTAGQGVQYGVNTAGQSVQYVVDKTGQIINTVVDDIGSSFKYLIERGDKENEHNHSKKHHKKESKKSGKNGTNYADGKNGTTNYADGSKNNGPPNYMSTPDIYRNPNGPVTPSFLPITSDFSAFGR